MGQKHEPNFADGANARAVLKAVLLSPGGRHWEKVPS